MTRKFVDEFLWKKTVPPLTYRRVSTEISNIVLPFIRTFILATSAVDGDL